MLNARRYESFCVDPSERWIIAGNTSGQLSVIDIDTFSIIRDVQAHVGTVRAVAAHPTLPYISAMANDRCVSVWEIGPEGTLHPVLYTPVRDVPCSNDTSFVPPILSHSVALAFHDTERRIVTRSGNGGVLEIEFDEAGTVRLLSCVRLHGTWDLQMTRYAKGSDQVLSAGRDGQLVLSDRGVEQRRWSFGETVAHWAEHLEGTTYLIASDAGLVARVDIASQEPPVLGHRFARDDMEYVTYNHTSGRAFATSFDRNVYEIDVHTCDALGVAYRPGYKCIWAKTLERHPSVLLVQSRNGGIYKADADSGATLGVIKETPAALWTAVSTPEGGFLLAGEGSSLLKIGRGEVDSVSRASLLTASVVPTPMPADTYTKRMVRQQSTGLLVAGRTDGEIWTSDQDSWRRLVDVGSAVRDIAVAPRGTDLFVATEDGRVLKLDLASGETVRTYRTEGIAFSRSVWALAYNPVRDILAFAEFGGDMRLVSGSDFTPIANFDCERPKRMRWVDAATLLFGHSDEVHRYIIGDSKPEAVVTLMQNTVEDFIWDNRRQYLLVICYQSTIALCDYASGEKLDLARDQLDYSKGLAWLDTSGDDRLYPWDFITWGRSGAAHRFRIHDERLVALGPVGGGLR